MHRTDTFKISAMTLILTVVGILAIIGVNMTSLSLFSLSMIAAFIFASL